MRMIKSLLIKMLAWGALNCTLAISKLIMGELTPAEQARMAAMTKNTKEKYDNLK